MKLDRKNLRIMLIEDSETECELLEERLVQAGFTHPLVQLRNGSVLLEFFKYAKAVDSLVPHIVLLDLNMPLVDGVHALQCLRATASFSNLPVIVLTGFEDPTKRVKLAEMGIFRFLGKLSDCTNVIAALDDFIGLSNRGADFSAHGAREVVPGFNFRRHTF